jgi:hypothetical protein
VYPGDPAARLGLDKSFTEMGIGGSYRKRKIILKMWKKI